VKRGEKETAANPDVPFWYLRWRLAENDRQDVGVWFAQPVLVLAETWCCTPRQVRRRLSELQQQGRIEYRSGRGRGHVTQLRFLRPARDELLRASKLLAEAGDTPVLIRLLNLPMPAALRLEAAGPLRALFGWSSPEQGRDVFRYMWRGDLPPIDPLCCYLTFTMNLISQLGDTLLRYDAKTQQVQPHLAHAHETTDGGRTWTLHLRKGVRFHHGLELTATDILHTFQRFQTGPANYAFLLADLVSVRALDPYTVQLELGEPNLFFPVFLTNAALVILPHDVPFDERVWTATGPFRLTDRKEERLQFQANDRYFLGRPLLDQVEVLLVQGPSAGVLSLSKEPSTPEDVPALEIEPGATYLVASGQPDSPLADRHLRLALTSLLDAQRMWTDLGRAPDAMLPARSFLPDRSRRSPVPPPLDARTLLSESGYQGETLRMLYLGKADYRFQKEAAWLQERAREVGIVIEIFPWLFEEVFHSEEAMVGADLILCTELFSDEPHLSFIAALKDTNLPFRHLLPEPVLGELDARLRVIQSLDFGGREEQMGELEQWLTREGWVTFTYHRVGTFHHAPHLKGLNMAAFGEADWRTLWFRPAQGSAENNSVVGAARN